MVTVLTRTMKSLRDLDMQTNTGLAEALVTDADNIFLFEHPRIVDCWHRMRSKQTIQPLMRLWTQIKEYRSLEDIQLAQEFAAFVTCLERAIQLKHAKTNPVCGPPELADATTNNTDVGTRAVAFRFYLLHRLEATLETIKMEKDISLTLFSYKFKEHDEETVFERLVSFRHPRIRHCIQELLDTQTNAPIRRLCREFRSFYYVGDFPFVTELLQLIFLYQRYLMCQKQTGDKRSLLSQCDLVEHWYKKLSTQSITALVDMVDGMDALSNAALSTIKKNSLSMSSFIRGIVFVKHAIDLLQFISRFIS